MHYLREQPFIADVLCQGHRSLDQVRPSRLASSTEAPPGQSEEMASFSVSVGTEQVEGRLNLLCGARPMTMLPA